MQIEAREQRLTAERGTHEVRGQPLSRFFWHPVLAGFAIAQQLAQPFFGSWHLVCCGTRLDRFPQPFRDSGANSSKCWLPVVSDLATVS
eukprot:COSAG04_NODE_270_length_18507_cov_125.250380_11_plen_89_part_00